MSWFHRSTSWFLRQLPAGVVHALGWLLRKPLRRGGKGGQAGGRGISTELSQQQAVWPSLAVCRRFAAA